jgi:hypothetical protein
MGAGIAGFQAAGQRAMQMLQGLGAAAAAFGAVRLAQQALSNADALEDMASQVNVSVENLQKLRFASQSAGGSAELMDRSLNLLSERIGEAATGSVSAQQSFADLGLQWQDLRVRDTAEVFGIIADALLRFPDAADRAARQAGIFGARSRDLNNLMQEGSQGIRAMGDRLQAVGGVLSSEMVAKLAAANKALETMATVLTARLTIALAALAPHIEGAANRLLRMVEALTGNQQAIARLTSSEAAFVSFLQTVALGASRVATAVGAA